MRSATSSRGRAAISFWRSVSCAENLVHRGTRGAEREGGEIRDGQAAELDRERFRAEAFAVADGALRRPTCTA